MIRNSSILNRKTTALLVIDIQEKILPVIRNAEQFLVNSKKLIEACTVMKVPIYLTEQYPKGLGSTTNFLTPYLSDAIKIEKSTFSCFGAPGLFNTLSETGITQLILTGIESHVCVQQTALDLVANGFSVSLAADACSSRKEIDYNIALSRMRHHGVDISTTEAIIFELLEKSGTEEFKQVSKLVK